MSYIKVDTSVIDIKANSLRQGLSTFNNIVGSVKSSIGSMQWSGEDALTFRNKWDSILSKKSSYDSFVTSINNSASFLEFASSQYKKAQNDAVEAALRLPRW